MLYITGQPSPMQWRFFLLQVSCVIIEKHRDVICPVQWSTLPSNANMTNLSDNFANSPFDAIRREDKNGEYWLATETLTLLGYKSWKRQKETVERAIISCQNADNDINLHFVEVVQMAQIGGSQAFRSVIKDYRLSRYGAYLTAMNGDPRKPEIAAAQNYFVVKTREAEIVIPQKSERIQELEMQLAIAQANAAITGNQVRLIEKTESLAAFHGVATALILMGRSDEVVEVEKPTIEIIDEKHNVTFRGQTLTQVAAFLEKRYGIRFKSGADIARYLRKHKRDDLIAQTKRSISSEYIPEEFLSEAYKVLSNGNKQLLLGE